MKRFISVLIIFTMLFVSFTVTAQENKYVSRAEFASAVSKLLPDLNIGDVAVADMLFVDVTSQSEFYDSISKIRLYGLVKGEPDGSFRPNDAITVGEAFAIVTRLIDDEQIIVKETPYPLGHMFYASDYGLSKGLSVQITDRVTNEIAEKLISNLNEYINGSSTYYIPSGVKTVPYKFDANSAEFEMEFDVVALAVEYPQIMCRVIPTNGSPEHKVKVIFTEKRTGEVVKEIDATAYADEYTKQVCRFDQIIPNRHFTITISPIESVTSAVEGELIIYYNEKEDEK